MDRQGLISLSCHVHYVAALVIHLIDVSSGIGELPEHRITTVERGKVDCREAFNVLHINKFQEAILKSALFMYQLKGCFIIFETRK